MIGRLALRSLTAHPVRSAVLAAGFGVGVAVMAILLGVAAIVLEQAQSPALVGGGDVLIRLSLPVPARLVLVGHAAVRCAATARSRGGASHTTDLYLLHDGRATRVAARGGIPSLERALGDPETAGMDAWRDTREDVAWTQAAAGRGAARRSIGFMAMPDAPAWADSWAEWLYFNGRSSDARFYLTFMVGPTHAGRRRAPPACACSSSATGRSRTSPARAMLTDAELATRARPDDRQQLGAARRAALPRFISI